MRQLRTRRAVLASVGATALAGCLGGTSDDETSSTDVDRESPDSVTAEETIGGTSTSDIGRQSTDRAAADGTGPPTVEERLLLPMGPSTLSERAISGGPPKDGIPSIDDPTFEAAETATARLDPGDPVFGIATGRTTKAYPQAILVSHEICNDVVDGTPVAVTYCPLTGTAMGFERGGTTFGVSGRLVNNNLIMYDRATETWWPQMVATAIPGPWKEDPAIRTLRQFRIVWTTWERWSAAYPDTQVLSRNTGFARNYDGDPYGSYNPRGGYYAPDSAPLFPSLSDDDRLAQKTVVIGARTTDGAVAFGKQTLRNETLIEGTLGGTPVVAVYEPTLDTGYVFRNPGGEDVRYRDGMIVDEAGESHPPASPPGERLLAFDAMWFAWSGFYPGTKLYG